MFKVNFRGLYLQEYDTIAFSIGQLQDIQDNEKCEIHGVNRVKNN